MKHILATIACGLLGIAAFVVLCELLFRALPVSSATKFGYHFDPKIPTYAPLHEAESLLPGGRGAQLVANETVPPRVR